MNTAPAPATSDRDQQSFAALIEQAVRRAPLCEDPFAHVQLDEVFGARAYDQIQRHLPDSATYAAGRSEDSVTERNPARSSWRLKEDQLSRPGAPADLLSFWIAFAQDLKASGLRRTLLEKFDAWLPASALRHPERLKFGVRLCRDEGGSVIGPHTDGPDKLVTCILYLPADASRTGLGTTLLAPRDPAFRPPEDADYRHDRFYDRADLFTAVRRMPFAPDSGMAFARSPLSFHALDVPAAETSRYTLLLAVRERT
uniref:Methyltransferase fkbm family n=1 Tax=Streptomyces sp. MMG1612 TaxID=1415547 RepID=U5YNY6_9ACTN|nr:methyltransferase fkbm family [Streptomyces sp. MMG1612]